ncbi:M13 family metallopeptidase [Sphingomonas panacisoli]|uniref:M13 family metallopeptidase n=1 Tax=Sphingomonas panacisoli TaxID=1813879 RepID=A0A5B8LIR6_9SPHN|nr:M13 family metallopeptidase [Sphingomonas panacisoli]QDZ07494.1 M13 family metallopeptidase [Sphingomonas panacisoli]
MKPFTFALLAATALGSVAIVQTASTAATTKAKPAFGTFGFDETGMDKSVAPGDDFYEFANGGWTKRTPIPADKSSFGAFEGLQDLSDQRTHGLLDAAATDANSKIGRAYSTYLDTAGIEAKGLAPIKPWLAKIEGSTKADYAALVAEATRNGVGTPFAPFVGQDAKDPNAYTLTMFQSGLSLPDRDYYLSDDPKLAAAKTAYRAHVAKMLTLAGESDVDARAAALVEFETEIAKVSWTNIQSRDADATYNKMTVTELQQKAPGFDFAAMFKAAGYRTDTLVVAQPSAITGIAALIAKAPDRVLKDQLIVGSLDGFADVLPQAFDAENFAMFGTVLSGTPQQRERWKRAVTFTNGALTDDVSKVYVAKYFPPATKAAADTMVKNIIAAMNVRIEKLDWMTPETKAKAHAKLAAFTPRIGYPSQWHDYAALEIVKGDAFGNELRANQWSFDDNRSKIGQPVRRWEWGLTPMTVNAQANPRLVAITFPAAIMQPPFFDPNADPAVNYGGMGAVIGHEMSHHFDDQGSKYDKNGKLTQWWTEADVAAFKKRSADLVAEYDKYEPLPGKFVKGALTLGENSADLAGLSASYDAYHNSLGGKPAPMIGGYTGDQRFYLGWAQVWRRSYREANLIQRLLIDPHAPSVQRSWIVRNMDPWYAAFKAQPGQKMYLPPEQRVRIW